MTHIHPHEEIENKRKVKEQLLNQHSVAIWMSGLSGAGKSTIALELEKMCTQQGLVTQILDGDNIRTGINKNLSFSDDDRKENLRRIAEVNKLFINCGIITINSFISPTEASRETARSIIGADNVVEVYIDAPLEVCEQRDVKGLYKKAREGKIKQFTGIDSVFEIPQHADVTVDTVHNTAEECARKIFEYIKVMVSYAT